jgi:hypothetical protein
MATSEYSDERLIQALREQPRIRQRLVELLSLVGDEEGDCRRADDAEDRFTQQLRGLGQEAMQAWAQAQVQASEHELRCGGGAHREGKKNSAGTPPSVILKSQSRSTAVAAGGCAHSPKAPGSAPADARGGCSAR